MKKRVVSIILMIVMVLSLIPSVYAEEDTDFGEILDFEELREALKKAESPFKTNEDKDEFRHMYWKSVLPDFSKEVYPKGHKLAGQPIGINNASIDAYKIFYYGHGGLIKENSKDSYGNINYLGYTADGEYVVNMLYNEKTMLNPKKEPIDKYFGKHNVKYYGKVRPFRTNYTKPRVVGEMYLGKEASSQDKEQYGKSIILEWMKHITVRDTGWEKGSVGQSFYDVFGGNVDEFIKYVAITCPPTSRSNGQATVWFISDNGLPENRMPNGKYQTRRTFVIEKTDPVDIIAIQDEFKGTTIKPDGSISFTFDYKVNGLERVKGETSVNYLLTVPDKYLLFDNYNKLANELPKGSQIHRINTSVGISGIAVNIPVDIDWNLMDEYQTISFDFKTPIFNLEYDISNPIESIFVDDSGIQISGQNTLVGINIGHLESFSPIFDYFKLTKGFKEYKEGAYDNNLIIGGLNKYAIELALLGRDSKGGHLKIGEPLEYRVKEDQKELDIQLTAFKAGDLTEDTKKTNVILYDEKGNEVIREEIELKGTTKPAEEVSKDLDIKLNIENLGKGEHKFYAVINSDFDLTKPDPITYEDVTMLENNKVEIKVIIPGEEDFELIANKHRIELDKKDKGEIELSYNVNLKGTEKGIPTVVDLYKDSVLIDSKNISLKGGENTDVVFNVHVSEEGATSFYGVVNADFNLKEARPYKEEKDLSNNKDEITVVLGEEIEEKSGDCEFSGGAGSKTYSIWTCDDWEWDEEKGRNVCTSGWYCKNHSLGTQNHAKLEYKDYSLGSNLYRTDKPGQEYGESKGVPKGKDLEGKPSYDELMAKIGYNPLYQVIQTGRGMQVKGIVRLTGGVQEFSSAKVDKLIKDFVEDRGQGTGGQVRCPTLLHYNGTTNLSETTEKVALKIFLVP